jgi:hypothetical protein
MPEWERPEPVAVGGVVAVALWDGTTVAVGSHSGLGLVDVRTRVTRRCVRDTDGTYAWYQADPPSIRREEPGGAALLPATGLWGGTFPAETSDGWSAALADRGAVLTHTDGTVLVVDDDDEPRAFGFSPDSAVFVFATSAALHVCVRSSA